MQENNFEKQVQQKMDELKFQPSDEVWQKVAANITKGKNDRRIVTFILFLLIFIGSAIFIIWNQTSDSKNNRTISENIIAASSNGNSDQPGVTIPHQKTSASNNPKNVEDVSAGDTKTLKIIPEEKEKSDQQNTVPVSIPAATSAMASVSRNESVNNNIPKSSSAKGAGFDNKNTAGKKNAKGKLTTLIDNGIPGEEMIEKEVSNEIVTSNGAELIPETSLIEINEPIVEPVSIDSIDLQKLLIDSTAELPAGENKQVIAVEKSLPLKQQSKWTIGFNISMGIAATQNGYLGITGPGDESKALFDAGQIGSGNPGPSTNIPYTPSAMKSGPGLFLGVFVHKNISPKTSLLLGLNYKVYSSSMNIGNKVDSNISFSGNNLRQGNFYYRTGNNASYKNNFHFIELPVALQIQLSKQNKRAVFLNTGISVAQLIASNALQFDTPNGAYYSNNDLFNKTQVGVSAGLLFALSRHTNNPFLLGPDINFSLNKMANSGLYSNRRYSYFGILLQKSIRRK